MASKDNPEVTLDENMALTGHSSEQTSQDGVIIDEKEPAALKAITQVNGTSKDETEEKALPDYDIAIDNNEVVSSAAEIVALIDVQDDPSINPWTFRMLFLGLGLSIFGGVLQEIFYFKPQVIYVSQVFLTAVAYVLGEGLAYIIPQKGRIGRSLNPGPFNHKEHAAVVLMASAATQSALTTQALAAQQLYYGGYPSHAAGVFITLSSQLIGFGIAGLLRDIIVRPTKMLWPMTLPISSLLESLHKDKAIAKQRIKAFYAVFLVAFFWTIIPEWVFPLLEGVSIFCLANQQSLVFTNLFGGASGNEGLGFLSFCFDWNYVASLGSPLWYPLYSLTNTFIGYLGCIILFMGIYYGNVWQSRNFPFLSQLLYYGDSNSTYFNPCNQTLILDENFVVNQTLLDEQGIPWISGTYASFLITSNVGLTAALMHMFLWNFDDIKSGWEWASPRRMKKWLKPESYRFWENVETPEQRLARVRGDESLDPHYRLMVANLYPDTAQWWWGAVLVSCFITSLVCLYVMKSTLPWWGFIISVILTFLFMLFFGAQYGLTGFQFNVQPVCQMLAGYMFPGKPLANMYFTCFTFNTLQQGQVLAKDLRLAQNTHFSPRCTFCVQVIGCLVGALFNYVMMLTIVQDQAAILISIDGTNIWSGASIQSLNSLAVAWSIAGDMFSAGGRYQWVTLSFLIGFAVPVPFWLANRYWPHKVFQYINTSIILWYMGWLVTGINASITVYFILGFAAQWWMRKYHPHLFNKYNYIVSAALDGGTQVCVFILTFAVFGDGGSPHSFPTWAARILARII